MPGGQGDHGTFRVQPQSNQSQCLVSRTQIPIHQFGVLPVQCTLMFERRQWLWWYGIYHSLIHSLTLSLSYRILLSHSFIISHQAVTGTGEISATTLAIEIAATLWMRWWFPLITTHYTQALSPHEWPNKWETKIWVWKCTLACTSMRMKTEKGTMIPMMTI